MTHAINEAILGANVSREAIASLRELESLVLKWTAAINLISRPTASEVWNRHILDSAQLFPLLPSSATTWADLGSGAGFPGLVIAIMARGAARPLQITLIESDARKATFLQEATRKLNLACTIITGRIENVPPQNAHVISARALAPLPKLLSWASSHLSDEGVAIFPKGRNWRDEVAEAQKLWSFDFDAAKSTSDPEAAILLIRNLSRVSN